MSQVCTAPRCGNPTTDRYLCNDCVRVLKDDLGKALWLWDELDVTRTRRARIGKDRVGGKGATVPLPWHQNASEAADDLHGTIHAWAQCLDPYSSEHIEPSRVKPTIEWMIRNVDAFARMEDAGLAAEEIEHAVARGMVVIDHPEERVFAGKCGHLEDGIACTEDLMGNPKKPTAKCYACGHIHSDMESRRAVMLSFIEDTACHSGVLSGLVTNLGVPIASSTIRHYASKGRLTVVSVDEKRRPLYRVGQVLDVFLKREIA